MNETYMRILKYALEQNKPKLFFAILCSWNYNGSTYSYLEKFQGTLVEEARIIKIHYTGNKIRPLIKKLATDAGVSVSLKCSSDWTYLPIDDTFDIRSDSIRKWISKHVYTSTGRGFNLPQSEITNLNHDEIIWWYNNRL